MADIRYRADWKSIDGFEYRVDIIDVDYDGSPNNLEIGMDSLDGFSITYSGEDNKRFSPVISSECVVSCVADNTAFESFIDDIVQAQEQRFYIAIYLKDTTYKLFWAGLILQDLIQIEDIALPYKFSLHATDGLGLLKDVDYDGTADYFETFIEYLINILTQSGINRFWETDDLFLKTGVDWYEDDQFTSSPANSLDPLAVSRVSNSAYIKIDKYNNEINETAWNVLQDICIKWHATLILSNGSFSFLQTNNLYPSTLNIRNYKKDGTYIDTSASESLLVLETAFKKQGSWSYLPALASAEITYNFKQAINLNNFLPEQTNYETAVGFGNVAGGGGSTVLFNGNVRCTLKDTNNPTAFDEFHQWKFHMRLQIGSYYYTNQNGVEQWTTNSSARYVVLSDVYHLPFGVSPAEYIRTFLTSFETLPILYSGAGTFEFDFIEFIDMNGETLSVPANVTYSYTCQNFNLTYNETYLLDPGEKRHKATNRNASNVAVKSSEELTFKNTFTGDGPFTYSCGLIEILNTSANWENSNGEWSIGGAYNGKQINSLLVAEAVAAQKIPVKFYNGMVSGISTVINPTDVLVFSGGNKYAFKNGTFNANFNTCEGGWVNISVDRNNNPVVEDDTIDKNLPDRGIKNSVNFLREEVDGIKKTTSSLGNKAIITGNHTIGDGDNIIYCNPGIAGLTITLPNYDQTQNQIIKIINISSSNSLTIAPDGSNDINGGSSSFTLSAADVVEIHNTGINDIKWATIIKTDRI